MGIPKFILKSPITLEIKQVLQEVLIVMFLNHKISF
jgi:hypothetical protein